MSKHEDVSEANAAPPAVAVHKRNYSVVKEASSSSSTDVIDLCSPVHTKPCRQSTPIIKTNSFDYAASAGGRSLFGGSDEIAVVQFQQDEEDEYWEPAGYMDNLVDPYAAQETPEPDDVASNGQVDDIFGAAHSFIVEQLRAQSQQQPSHSDEADDVSITSKEYDHKAPVPSTEVPAKTHCNDDVIDLCSPVSSKASSFAFPSHSEPVNVQAVKTSTCSAKMLTEADPIELSSDEEGSASYDGSNEGLPVRTGSYGWTAAAHSVLSESNTQQSYASSSQYSAHVAVTHSLQQQTQRRSLFSMVSSGPTLSDYAAGAGESQQSGSFRTEAPKVPAGAASSSHGGASSAQAARGLHQLFSAAAQQVEEKQRLTQPQKAPATTSSSVSAKPTSALPQSNNSTENVALPDRAAEATFLQRSVSLPSASKPAKKVTATKTVAKEKVAKGVPPASAATSVLVNATVPVAQPVVPAVLRRAESQPTVARATSAAPKTATFSGTAAAVMPGIPAPPCLALPKKEKALPATAPAGSSFSGISAGAAAEPPKFRSRFTEKTLSALPPLPAETRWEVLLLIDKRERSNALIQSSMSARNIPCQLATLAVGDFLWVARMRTSSGAQQIGANVAGATVAVPIISANGSRQGKGSSSAAQSQALPPDEDTQLSAVSDLGDLGELGDEEIEDCDIFNTFVLDCIAERKSISDLASSMCDGRYNEQKNRLRACALRSTMYIIEGEHIVMSMHQKAISATHIKTAMVSIHVDSGMHILRTRGMDHTIVCLQNLHRQVEQRFQQDAQSASQYQTLAQFQTMYGKKGAATHRQLFGHQLRQIHGCSTSVALTLMSRYGTTARFMDELKMLGQTKAEYTLSNMVNEVTKRKLGPKLAQRLCQIYLTKF